MYKNLVAALAAACFFPPFARATAPPEGLVLSMSRRITERAGTRQHEEGRKAVDAALGAQVKTTFVENVAEGADAERVIRDLARQGHRLIFTPSFGYMEPTLKVAKDSPDVKFESITGYKTAPNVATANARYYEGRYLAGIAAGRMTRSNVAGYVAGFPIPEVLQGINAFTLGMRSVNPKARSRWCGSTPGSTRRASATPP
jgi:basic membrane protein A